MKTKKTILLMFYFCTILMSTAIFAALPEGFLRGTFIVRCPSGHDDQVEGITRNHDCEKCGKKAVDEGTAQVVCPDGHDSRVEGITESHLCTFRYASGAMCGKQCRR